MFFVSPKTYTHTHPWLCTAFGVRLSVSHALPLRTRFRSTRGFALHALPLRTRFRSTRASDSHAHLMRTRFRLTRSSALHALPLRTCFYSARVSASHALPLHTRFRCARVSAPHALPWLLARKSSIHPPTTHPHSTFSYIDVQGERPTMPVGKSRGPPRTRESGKADWNHFFHDRLLVLKIGMFMAYVYVITKSEAPIVQAMSKKKNVQTK